MAPAAHDRLAGNLGARAGLRACINPFAALTLNLFYYHYRIEDQATQLLSPVTSHAGNLEHQDFGDEVGLTLDWEADPHVAFSAVLAAFEPARGGEDFFGGDQTWLGFILSATLRF